MRTEFNHKHEYGNLYAYVTDDVGKQAVLADARQVLPSGTRFQIVKFTSKHGNYLGWAYNPGRDRAAKFQIIEEHIA